MQQTNMTKSSGMTTSFGSHRIRRERQEIHGYASFSQESLRDLSNRTYHLDQNPIRSPVTPIVPVHCRLFLYHLYRMLIPICDHDDLVHAILGIRAWPDLVFGRTDSQDRMDHQE